MEEFNYNGLCIGPEGSSVDSQLRPQSHVAPHVSVDLLGNELPIAIGDADRGADGDRLTTL